jgi:hypothetical protein
LTRPGILGAPAEPIDRVCKVQIEYPRGWDSITVAMSKDFYVTTINGGALLFSDVYGHGRSQHLIFAANHWRRLMCRDLRIPSDAIRHEDIVK